MEHLHHWTTVIQKCHMFWFAALLYNGGDHCCLKSVFLYTPHPSWDREALWICCPLWLQSGRYLDLQHNISWLVDTHIYESLWFTTDSQGVLALPSHRVYLRFIFLLAHLSSHLWSIVRLIRVLYLQLVLSCLKDDHPHPHQSILVYPIVVL